MSMLLFLFVFNGMNAANADLINDKESAEMIAGNPELKMVMAATGQIPMPNNLWRVTYQMTFKNTGDEPLMNLELEDDVYNQMGLDLALYNHLLPKIQV